MKEELEQQNKYPEVEEEEIAKNSKKKNKKELSWSMTEEQALLTLVKQHHNQWTLIKCIFSSEWILICSQGKWKEQFPHIAQSNNSYSHWTQMVRKGRRLIHRCSLTNTVKTHFAERILKKANYHDQKKKQRKQVQV
jgi:hypothetical protein